MLQMDCQELKDVDEYFNGLFDYVQNIRNFQGVSQVYEDGTLTLTAAYACRQNILMLIKDLAFASFQRRQGSGLCLDDDVHASMMKVLDTHEKWLKASKVGMTTLFFHIDYIRDILTLIPTTKGNVNTVDVLAKASTVFYECVSMNITGAAVTLTKDLVSTIARVAIAKARISGATKTIDTMVKCGAVVRPLVTRSDISVDMLFETFLTILKDIYASRRDWKVYIQVVTDLGKVIAATASKEKRMLLINGSKQRNLVGLQGLSTFVRLKVHFGFREDERNWRVRETVLVVVLDLAGSGRLTEEEVECLREILFARRYVEKSEPETIQRLLNTELARNLLAEGYFARRWKT